MVVSKSISKNSMAVATVV